MTPLLCRALCLTFAAFSATSARNAADLKADFASMMPVGKTEIRMAWFKKGSGINKVSSADGIITNLRGTGSYSAVCVAASGQRVFFFNSGSGRLGVINWDGTGFKEVSVGGDVYEYWCNPADGSDWVIVNRGGSSRVKVDAPGTVVVVSNGNGGDGCGLTDDGKWFFAYYDGAEAVSYSMCSTADFKWTFGPHGGCVGSLSGGSSPRYNHNPSGHTQFCVHDAMNQTTFTMYAVTDSIQKNLTKWGQKLAGCYDGNSGGNPSQEGTRFTQSPDFLTCTASTSKVNPILVRIPDLKMIYIEDNLSCMQCWDADAVFLPYSTTAVRPLTSSALARGTGASMETYSLDGRRLAPGFHAGMRGDCAPVRSVVIRRNQGRAAGVRALVD